jgi:hypothetical protein
LRREPKALTGLFVRPFEVKEPALLARLVRWWTDAIEGRGEILMVVWSRSAGKYFMTAARGARKKLEVLPNRIVIQFGPYHGAGQPVFLVRDRFH